jgi:hypothetical protein
MFIAVFIALRVKRAVNYLVERALDITSDSIGGSMARAV